MCVCGGGSAFLSWSFLFPVLDPMLPEQQLSARSSLVVMSQAGFRSALGGAVAMSSASVCGGLPSSQS